MENLTTTYGALVSVLKYPEEDYHEQVDRCAALIAENAPCIAERYDTFKAAISGKSLAELEELYINTFDLNPLCTLDLGWQLFQEDFNRGLFLVKMREEMRRLGVPESVELPDHISHVLAVIARMDNEDASDFAVTCVIPAVGKVFEALRKDNPYRSLIKGLIELLETRFGSVSEATDTPVEETEHAPTDALQETRHE